MTENKTEKLIYKKIIAVLKDVGAVAKSEKNVEQKFNYRGIDAVVNAVNPVLKKHEVFIAHNVLRHETERYENANKKIVTDAQVEIEYTWYAEDGSSLSNTAVGEARDFADKATAKAMSVAFRTHLLQLLALPTDERDPDSESLEVTVGDNGRAKPGSKPAQATQAATAPTGPSLGDFQATIRQIISNDEVVNEKTGAVVDTSKITALKLNEMGTKLVPEGVDYKRDANALQKLIEEILG